MADYRVKVIIDGIAGGVPAYAYWDGETILDLVTDVDPLRVAFELGGLFADAIAEAADAGDDRACAALEAKAVTRG